MAQIYEKEVTGGSLTFKIEDGGARVLECKVEEAFFEIPGSLEQKPVTSIEKKAVLSGKKLKELALPDTLEEIGDWAFAHCTYLSRVWMPRKAIRFGRGVFKDCERLADISFKEETGPEAEKLSKLLGAVPVKLLSDYLLHPAEAGSRVWFSMYDARLLTLLQKPDREGYSRQVLCGEEDLMANLEEYMADVRREKAQLCYLRLLNDTELSEELRERLNAFLRENTKGCEYEAAWEVLRRDFSASSGHYRIFTEAGCVTEENFSGLLLDMGEENPEMKAYLMRYKGEKMPETDFFSSLSLD